MDNILKYQREEDDDYYRLLGCDENATTEQISAEYKALCLLHHPDKNIHDQDTVTKFQKILKAKEVLSDPEKRAVYDKWYRSGFSVPFEQFLNFNKAAHTSIHWVCKKKKDLMINSGCSESNQDCMNECTPSEGICRTVIWERDPASEHLQKFRNYEI